MSSPSTSGGPAPGSSQRAQLPGVRGTRRHHVTAGRRRCWVCVGMPAGPAETREARTRPTASGLAARPCVSRYLQMSAQAVTFATRTRAIRGTGRCRRRSDVFQGWNPPLLRQSRRPARRSSTTGGPAAAAVCTGHRVVASGGIAQTPGEMHLGGCADGGRATGQPPRSRRTAMRVSSVSGLVRWRSRPEASTFLPTCLSLQPVTAAITRPLPGRASRIRRATS